MLDRTGVIFCSAGILLASVACTAGFAVAALPAATLEAARTPVPPESLPDVDIPGFGKVSPVELMSYYIDNPPQPKSAGGDAAAAAPRFGGC